MTALSFLGAEAPGRPQDLRLGLKSLVALEGGRPQKHSRIG